MIPAVTTLVLAFAVSILPVAGAQPAYAQPANLTEAPPVMLAKEALGPDLLRGPDHLVEDFVYNDGAINRYQVTSTYGRHSVRSTALLRLRVYELLALRRIEQLEQTDLYARARQAAATSPLAQQKMAILGRPGVAGPSGGAGAFFGGPVSPDGVGVDLSMTAGKFERYRRRFAYSAGLNPYSRFDALQQVVREYAWTCFAGGVEVDAAFAAIADAPVKLPPARAFDDLIAKRIRDETATQLRERNVQLLVGMGVNESVARVLQGQPLYTPVARTVITEALARMPEVQGRQVFVERAALIHEVALAQQIQDWAELLAGYHNNVEPVARIIQLGSSPFMVTADGKIVGVFAMDLLVWTQQTANALDTLSGQLARVPGLTGRELWFAGSVTPLTRQNLEKRGWKVEENTAARLDLK